MWVPEQEDKWTPRYHTSKFFKVINQAHRSLNKICSIFLFNNDNFQNERPDSNVAILGFPGAWHWDVVSSWGVGARPPSFPITTLLCEGTVSIPALTPSSAHTPYKQSPLNLSLGPGVAHTRGVTPIEEEPVWSWKWLGSTWAGKFGHPGYPECGLKGAHRSG